MELKEDIQEDILAANIQQEYYADLESNFNNLFPHLCDMGFDKDDFEDEEWIKYDIFLCGSTIDSMALFNILDDTQAKRIFKFISVDIPLGLDSREQSDYSISEIAEYKNLWDKSIKENEYPYDRIFSKLFGNLLGENISKYSIGTFHMMELMNIVKIIFIGKWSKALKKYTPMRMNMNYGYKRQYEQ